MLFSGVVVSSEISFEIQGNDYTDYNVILSLLDEIPTNLDDQYSNQIIKKLNELNLFSDVSVEFIENKYIIKVIEFPTINKLFFNNNERLKDDELKIIASSIDLKIFNTNSINLFINEIKRAYVSFGYNNVNIKYSEKLYEDTNTESLYINANKLVQYGWSKEAVPIVQEKKSKISRLFNLFFK